MDIKVVLFDIDGVLTLDYDAATSICRYISNQTEASYEDLLENYRPHVPKLDAGRTSYEYVWKQVGHSMKLEFDHSVLLQALSANSQNKDMFDLAAALKKSGLKVGIISNNSKVRAAALVEGFKLDKLFDPVIFSSMVSTNKAGLYGGAEIFNRALKPLKLKPAQAIFIDNTEANLEIPHEMGFHTYHFDDELNDIMALKIYLSSFGIKT